MGAYLGLDGHAQGSRARLRTHGGGAQRSREMEKVVLVGHDCGSMALLR